MRHRCDVLHNSHAQIRLMAELVDGVLDGRDKDRLMAELVVEVEDLHGCDNDPICNRRSS